MDRVRVLWLLLTGSTNVAANNTKNDLYCLMLRVIKWQSPANRNMLFYLKRINEEVR